MKSSRAGPRLTSVARNAGKVPCQVQLAAEQSVSSAAYAEAAGMLDAALKPLDKGFRALAACSIDRAGSVPLLLPNTVIDYGVAHRRILGFIMHPRPAAVIRSTSATMTARAERTTPCRSISARAP
jgi:hypothetical protein